ncbi:MAG: transcription elongation factor subunit Spt4 [Pyrobaculum sp.]
MRKKTLSGYKACRHCKYIAPRDARQCPNCGSEEFVDRWRGMIAVVDPARSCVAKRLGIEKPGVYALELAEE